MLDTITNYFPALTDVQRDQLAQLEALYREWNQRINVISRKDIDQLYEHHVLHSLAIARVVQFRPGSRILDLGTGGGFPGIPLAILFPQTRFVLIDGTRKKIQVVQAVAEALGLSNVRPEHRRAEEVKGEKFDFVVSRAVAALSTLTHWSFRLISNKQQHGLPNGLIALKGGQIDAEIKSLPKGSYVETYPIQKFFDRPYFDEKYVVYVQY